MMDVENRLNNLFDDKTYELINIPFENNDPLKFKDLKKYSDRMKAAQKKTDQKDAAILAKGNIGNIEVVVFILDFNFMGGSMGQFVGEAFKIGCEKQLNLNVLLYQFHLRRCKDARGNCQFNAASKNSCSCEYVRST